MRHCKKTETTQVGDNAAVTGCLGGMFRALCSRLVNNQKIATIYNQLWTRWDQRGERNGQEDKIYFCQHIVVMSIICTSLYCPLYMHIVVIVVISLYHLHRASCLRGGGGWRWQDKQRESSWGGTTGLRWLPAQRGGGGWGGARLKHLRYILVKCWGDL